MEATVQVREAGKVIIESSDLQVGDRVTYTIEHQAPIDPEERRRMWQELFAEIERDRIEHPERFRTKEEIDASLRAERDAWD